MKKHPKPKLMTPELVEFIWNWIWEGHFPHEDPKPESKKLLDQAMKMTRANGFAKGLANKIMYRGLGVPLEGRDPFDVVDGIFLGRKLVLDRVDVESWTLDFKQAEDYQSDGLDLSRDALAIVLRRPVMEKTIFLNLSSDDLVRRMIGDAADRDRWVNQEELATSQQCVRCGIESIASLAFSVWDFPYEEYRRRMSELKTSLRRAGWTVKGNLLRKGQTRQAVRIEDNKKATIAKL